MRLLVLGGGDFVGRAVVEDGLARGWEVTVVNRGLSEVTPGARMLRADRRSPGSAELRDVLGSARWDVAVDTWSWEPRAVRESAGLLADRVERYVYISTRSVYEWPTPAAADESAALVAPGSDDSADDYARAKRGAELAVIEAFGDRAILARAGLILGPRENIGRLPWWLSRIARGGAVLAPGEPDAGVQYVDARDLAAWCLDAAAAGEGGAFNIVSPEGAATMGELLRACVEATGSDATLRWVDAETVLAAGIEPWMELPVWIPPGEDHDTMHRADVSRAVTAGLSIRPLSETVSDTWRWLQSRGGTAPQRVDRRAVGLDPEKEAAVLAGLPAV
ncbi:nucleoside-diphosphate-sugar epimerase [Homoserinimonas aerilata]|uniref:Nucleoside-diphosphate-sugar epimerase n=1 Tax=Homoserinimonas aerilata TaxID=1162970 RepID=A0A542YI32_9MICO|nr:NAD-dependent epimerase/dehydratase family protein [Homoserinimonas aerilata]TQL47760.1 nucleoside-diphosphate-sugar epimerase [Homoserinimonas aerilata]